MSTASETILALEKALEAGPTPIATDLCGDRYMEGPHSYAELTREQDAFFTACSPLAIRTLLDAHASALRDAAKLRAKLDALDNLPAEDFIRKVARQMGPPPFDTWPVSHVCQQNADEAVELVAEYDRLAALDDNTKGAAE